MEQLNLEAVIGFGGNVSSGLHVHPDGKTLIYPLGSTIVIRDHGDAKSQEFLQGHSDKVSCLAISQDGRYLASGQVTYMGFTADIIIWDLENRTLLHRMGLHKVKVQALSFSCDSKYLASLGGQDDNALVVWEVETGKPVCGSPTNSDIVNTVKFFNQTNTKLITGGSLNLDVWEFDAAARKLRKNLVHLGQMKRVTNTIAIDAYDEYAYCGTKSGDLLQVSLGNRLFKNSGPEKQVLEGVLCTAITPLGDIVCGGGDGSINVIPAISPVAGPEAKRRPLRSKASIKLQSGVTSITLAYADRGGNFTFFAGTQRCNIFMVHYDAGSNKLTSELLQTCHFDKINWIAFPQGYSEVFATSSMNDIRVWHVETCRELLRVTVPNLECNCVAFSADGKSIMSGWSDGKIRAFGPQSGKLLFTIHDAHQQGVTAIVGTADNQRIISGGKEGMVRVWQIGTESQPMIASMKEHKGAVNHITMKSDDSQCVSASSDGSCIVWELTGPNPFKRVTSLFANTFFKSVLYHPDESQLVTTGTDRKITYWDAYDGSAIRILDGSDTAEMNSLAISPDGKGIASGGGDKLIKLWGYDEGFCYYVGRGHSGKVTNVSISPDCRKVVSVGAEGAIFIWEYTTPVPS